jgi:hypothetical protein
MMDVVAKLHRAPPLQVVIGQAAAPIPTSSPGTLDVCFMKESQSLGRVHSTSTYLCERVKSCATQRKDDNYKGISNTQA